MQRVPYFKKKRLEEKKLENILNGYMGEISNNINSLRLL